jgi:hypothetical protein
MKKLTILITLILIFFNGCDRKETNKNIEAIPFIVNCQNKFIPEFSLGYESNPTQQQVDVLCDCLQKKLIGWEKDTSIKLANGKQNEVNSLHMKAFPARFGKRINECAGDKL